MTTTLLGRRETTPTPPDLRPPPVRPVGTGAPPLRRPHRARWIVLAAAATLVGSLVVGASGGSGPAGPPTAGSCLDVAVLPCAVLAGQTYRGTPVDTAAVAGAGERAVTTVLAHVLGRQTNEIKIEPATGSLTGDSGEFSFTPADLTGAERFSWSYTGPESALAYLTVQTDRGMVVVGTAGLRGGTVDVAALLDGATVTGVRFWITRAVFARPVGATRMHGSGFPGLSMIGRITDGRVACVGVETAQPGYCAFTPASGAWMESADGDWAFAGQPISPTGQPGRDWIVAGAVYPDGTYPALMPTGHDTAGTSGSVPLSAGATPEKFLSPHNASGFTLQNHATREVCTSSFPHPDNAKLTRSPSPGVYCYIGRGAALNDPKGRERDEHGVYLPDTHHAHIVVLSPTHTVIVAKRPATTNSPIAVNPNSPLVWRPVSPLPIANN
jgi:hypothetical protein